MAAALLQRSADAAGFDVSVTSAGTHRVDLPVDPQAVKAAAALGIDIAGHVPREASSALLHTDGADLVLTMTREHLRTLVARDGDCFSRTFTLLEAVRRAGGLPPSASLESWADWLAVLGEGRTAGELLRPCADDDVADPYGRPLTQVRRAARRLDKAAGTLVAGFPTTVPMVGH